MGITEIDLEKLRFEVSLRVGEKRFSHIIAVEECAAALGGLILPEKLNELRAAAILHDVTKYLSVEEHISFIEKSGFHLTDEDRQTVGVLHSFSAPYVIRCDFPEFATEDILSAVEKHTVGSFDMSIFDEIIFVSDYAEHTRTYISCKEVRKFLFENLLEISSGDRIQRLHKACLMAIKGSKEALLRMDSPINTRMFDAEKHLNTKILK